ncbi:acetyltransferase-like isoleucine patch superfamily enzyme [Paenibacillus sp. V4I3]|uniref:acyltransferase n=1 Tax=unclassified Paenibacillus TaxID=185978 RepID=UPI00278486A4|nr:MULTISPECIES: acyltransferase [unclassified Paenibacillus]MDQ0873651.1 acetyltransferase-like isoleucine patch superfamily enzyme [Paenibacillus sp. V4I3]MDQ0890417.1 acetyltransferase-like isoleucine patch superfamily enzyme [Paenibacillus sp. V4I9]
MSLWTILDGAYSMPGKQTWGRRLACRFGYWLASRHPRSNIHPTCLISPEARICPRDGAIEIGEHSTVALGVLLQGNVTVGKYCSIQAYSNIVGYGFSQDTSGRIMIGNYVRIASHAIIIAGNHRFDDVDNPIYKQGVEFAPITIEDDVWIAGRVNITAGVTIGKGSVIGGGSVVTRDIPPYSVAVGVPAKVIKRRIAND